MPFDEAVARRAEDREGRHVGAEQGEHEDERAQRPSGEKEVLGAARHCLAESEDPDVDDENEVGRDDEERNHSLPLLDSDEARSPSSAASRREGHATRMRPQTSSETASV